MGALNFRQIEIDFFKKLETVEIAYCFRSLKNRLPWWNGIVAS